MVPWETLLNSLTVSSLIQISIKLLCSLFFIKISLFLQLCLLFCLLPLYLKFNSYDACRSFFADIFWKYLPESSYDRLDPDRDDDLYLYNGDWNRSWYNRGLLFFVYFFIAFRLFILQEPYLSLILKFIAIRYFLLNEHLFIAYLISFVFILSRFIFLLSDKTLSNWRLSIETFLQNKEGVPKVTKENIKIMTHWSLRDIFFWNMFLIRRNKKSNIKFDFDIEHHETLKEKFNLQSEKIKTK